MLKFIRRIVIKYITPKIWKMSPERKIQALLEFSLIEKDSGTQLFHCINLIKDPQIKAELFQHVLEEFCHADLFDSLVKEYSDSFRNIPIIPRDYSLNHDSKMEDIIQFYSYAHVGESDVNEDFLIYGKSALDSSVKRIFTRVSADENRHEVGTADILLKLCHMKKSLYLKFIYTSKLKRFWKQIEAQLKMIGQFQLGLILGLVYFLVGPFIYSRLKSRLTAETDDQLQILNSQIQDLSRTAK